MASLLTTCRRRLLMATRPWLWSEKHLSKNSLSHDPLVEFSRWYKRAERCFWLEFPDAMCLASVDEKGNPASRFVLLKSFDEQGFVFYSNMHSRKGRAIELKPFVEATFYWEALHSQIRIAGKVQPIQSQESDAYFNSRPRGSQIGAWASRQSEVLKSREELEKRFVNLQKEFYGNPVPRPPHWGGYRIMPSRYEFWRARTGRLHDRFEYLRDSEGNWCLERLNP